MNCVSNNTAQALVSWGKKIKSPFYCLILRWHL